MGLAGGIRRTSNKVLKMPTEAQRQEYAGCLSLLPLSNVPPVPSCVRNSQKPRHMKVWKVQQHRLSISHPYSLLLPGYKGEQRRWQRGCQCKHIQEKPRLFITCEPKAKCFMYPTYINSVLVTEQSEYGNKVSRKFNLFLIDCLDFLKE